MGGTIARKSVIAGLTAALLLSGLLVGVSYGGGGGITEPQVIELVSTGCTPGDGDPQTECASYSLRDSDGNRSGLLTRFKVPILDIDGNPVGKGFVECFEARGTKSICTVILSLQPGPYTEQGEIVSTGLGIGPRTSPITGGSGAYLNVRGQLTGGPHPDDPDAFLVTLNLIP
jgi:hypothetical protein